jgi:ribokinase
VQEPEVAVVGQVARDLVLVVDTVPGPSGSVQVNQRREMLGGKGANIAVGLSQLGLSVALVGVVGDDSVGDDLISQCRADGIDTTAVRQRSQTESALMVDVVTSDGQWRYLESVPRDALLTAADVQAASSVLAAAATVVIQLQQPAEAVLTALDQVPDRCRIVLDGVLTDVHARARALRAATVVRMDSHEADLLVGHNIIGHRAAAAVARHLLDQGPQLVVIAVGGEGNLVSWPEGEVLLPLITDAPIVDTTGGGDAFVAALTWALQRGGDPQRAGQLATAAAGLTVSHAGGRPSLTPARLQHLVDN